jgi:hypothetical protein
MKKLTVEISEKAHEALLRLQFERKIKKLNRATVKDVASDFLTIKLEDLEKKNPTE